MKQLLALLLFIGASAAAGADKPNILFIYADDQSYRTVGCYPEAFDWVRTPAIDSLAENGVRFANAYIGTWCMPSRATLLTGHHQFGIESMRMEGPYPGSKYDPDKCPFWPKHFRENGYQTAHIGKWHTGTDTGMGRDWDYQIVWNRPKFTDNSRKYFYDQMITFNDGETRKVDGYSTDNYTKWALEYIHGEKGRDEEKPWYLWLCYGAVHGPFTPADRHIGQYADAEVPVPEDIFGPRPGKPDWQQKSSAFKKRGDGEIMSGGKTFADAVRQYHEGVLAIDEGVQQLLDALKESGQYENTLIVYTADQGFAWGQHGFRSKVAAYDATIRAPLLVSMPSRLPSGAVCETPVGGVDLIPTFYNFAGIEQPWEMHGHDLTPLLKDPKADWPHPVLMVNSWRAYGSNTHQVPRDESAFRNGIPWYVMIRQGRYKYVQSLVENELDEFYDLEKDPDELTNQSRNPEFAGRVEEYRATMMAELKRTGAKLVDDLPKVRD